MHTFSDYSPTQLIESRHGKYDIFFIDSSFASENGIVKLQPRQACSIESAALMNPNSTVNLYVVTKKKVKFGKYI